jgi:hypothetical protein
MGQILFLAGDLDVVATAINEKAEVGTPVWLDYTHRVPRPDQGGCGFDECEHCTSNGLTKGPDIRQEKGGLVTRLFSSCVTGWR